ncbi:zinc-ribbon domain-containing protein [Rhodopseudomonas palustris]|uniref:zinc-ribbon domain-containing protein n=1 Tax=Rhodopseudomonas palustris TaxID=1076 RepID=UPI003D318961
MRNVGAGHGRGRGGRSHGRYYDPPEEYENNREFAPQRVLVCPTCRSDNLPNSRFCAQCGQRLGTAERNCVDCGSKLAAEAKFCPSCGKAAP